MKKILLVLNILVLNILAIVVVDSVNWHTANKQLRKTVINQANLIDSLANTHNDIEDVGLTK